MIRTATLGAIASRRRIPILAGGVTDPSFANVVSLLHFDGADASTTFTDVIGKTWTATGSAQLDTAQSKFGSASLLLDGTGDYISTGSSADFGYGTADFTIEYWLRVNSMATDIHFDQRIADPTVFPVVYHTNLGSLNYFVNGAARITSANGVITSAASFMHIALCRASGTSRLFAAGTQVGSNYSDSHNFASSPFRLGDGFDVLNSLNGWIDDLRVTKGVARYTANFTPPTAAFPDS